MNKEGVRIDAPSNEPSSWRVAVLVPTKGWLVFGWFPGEGARITERRGLDFRLRRSLYVAYPRFTAALARARQEFTELFRLRGKSLGDEKKTA